MPPAKDNTEEIQRLIYEQLKQGHSRHQSFCNLCEHLNYEQVDETALKKWLDLTEARHQSFLDFHKGLGYEQMDGTALGEWLDLAKPRDRMSCPELFDNKDHANTNLCLELYRLNNQIYHEHETKVAEYKIPTMNFPKVLNNQYVLGANIINEKIPGYPLFDVLEPKIFLKNICGFTLYNLFHDQQKEIVIDFELQKIVRGQKPFVVQINSELMILIQNWQLNRDADRLFNINLLKFNFEEFRIERLDTRTVTGMFEYFIVDQKNPNEFLFIYEPARLEKLLVKMGSIDNGKLVIESRIFELELRTNDFRFESQMAAHPDFEAQIAAHFASIPQIAAQFGPGLGARMAAHAALMSGPQISDYAGFKLEDKKLYAISCTKNNQVMSLNGIPQQETKYFYGQFNLNTRVLNFENLYPLYVCDGTTFNIRSSYKAPYQWSGSKCYISQTGVESLRNFDTLIVFDVLDGSIKSWKLGFAGKCIDMNLDDGVLTLCTKQEDTFAFRRFAINEPDSLKKMTWLRIRQQLKFFDNNAYNKTLEQTPDNMKPFL